MIYEYIYIYIYINQSTANYLNQILVNCLIFSYLLFLDNEKFFRQAINQLNVNLVLMRK